MGGGGPLRVHVIQDPPNITELGINGAFSVRLPLSHASSERKHFFDVKRGPARPRPRVPASLAALRSERGPPNVPLPGGAAGDFASRAAARGGFSQVLNSSARQRLSGQTLNRRGASRSESRPGKGGCGVTLPHPHLPSSPQEWRQMTGREVGRWAVPSLPVAGDPAPPRTRPTRGRSCLLWRVRLAGLTVSPQAPRWKKPRSSELGARPLPPATAGDEARREGSP